MSLLKEGVIILRNWTVFLGHGMSDIIEAPNIYDVIESDGRYFLGCNGIL